MSILIKGAKMPKNCKTCGFVVCDDEYSPEYWCPIVRDSIDNYMNCRHKLCPLVEIPPHGRLIDADKTISIIKNTVKGWDFQDTWDSICNMLDSAQTVIESEEQEHDT